MANKLLWKPSEERKKSANITRFIEFVNSKYGTSISNYSELYQFSIEEVENFYSSMWSFFGVKSSTPYTSIVENLKEFPPTTKWFVGAKLNFAENLLRYKDDHIALLFQGEKKGPISLTYKELHEIVSKLSTSLRNLGIKPGDRIAAYMPNIIETVIAMLATTSLGATWTSCGAELGATAALDRLGQVEPRILFTVDGYTYKEETFSQMEKLQAVVPNIKSLEKVVVVPFVDNDFDIYKLPNCVWFDDFLTPLENSSLDFVQVDFSDPLYIMYSSGTTGKPKCLTQSVGGILLGHGKEHFLHTDTRREDRIMYLTSPSWMMHPWLMSALMTGATVVLFEGNPLHPDFRRLWKFIQDEKITIFGCSASYLHYLKSIDAKPGKEFDLTHLREISQTGSALSPEGFEYVYDEIKRDLHFNSISGGTDINGCFAAGTPIQPVYAGELQGLGLGMKVVAYDENANPIFDTQGELVCELPSPSMPIYFWNDPDGSKYQNAYFNYYTDRKVWRHGDYIQISSKTGGVQFFGRSDATLKPSGVRIGTSEIYNIVEDFPEVADSLAIGQQFNNDQRILLFVQLVEGTSLTPDLQDKIKTELRTKASPRHVPAKIFQLNDIPYTFSGKKVESAVTNIIHGRAVTNRGALRNPESLDYFENIKSQLQD